MYTYAPLCIVNSISASWLQYANIQAADYYTTRMGFTKFAYSGLETGSRNVVSWIVKQKDVSIL